MSGLRSSTSAPALNSPAFVCVWHWGGELLWPEWVTQKACGPPDTRRRVLGKTPQSFRETQGEQLSSCYRLGARMLNCNREAAAYPEHAEKRAQFSFPNDSILISLTDKSGCGLSPPHSPSGQSWVCITDPQHEVSCSREGLATPLSSNRPAPFITPADRFDLCTWEKREKQQKPHDTLSSLQQESKIIASHSSCAAFRAFLAWALFLTSSTMTILQVLSQSSFPHGSSTVRNSSYTCTLTKLNMHTLSK